MTLVHKGNIMKFTEGGFRQWGYDVAAQEFGDLTCTEKEPVEGRLVVKDRIADAMFQEALLRPEQYQILATPNLNGDYISDALAAQAIIHNDIFDISAGDKIRDDTGAANQGIVFQQHERIRIFKCFFGGAAYTGRAPVLFFD